MNFVKVSGFIGKGKRDRKQGTETNIGEREEEAEVYYEYLYYAVTFLNLTSVHIHLKKPNLTCQTKIKKNCFEISLNFFLNETFWLTLFTMNEPERATVRERVVEIC